MNSPAKDSANTIDFKRIVWPLAVAETLFWAATFYVFHPLLPRFEAHFNWHKAEITGAFTLAMLCSAFFAPWVGALIDRGKGRWVMGCGGIIASVSLLALSFVESLWQFYAIWLVIGLCHAMILYEPCFAILTRLFVENAHRAITVVTLMAGLAGSIAFPLAYVLSESIGWQNGLWVFAAIAAVATLIAISCVPTMSEPLTGPTAAGDPATDSALRSAMGRGVFWCLGIAFALMALNHGALLPHLLPLFAERGVSAGSAVFAAALIGPMQVLGRVLMILVQRRASMSTIALLSFIVISIASLILYFAGSYFYLMLLFIVFQGAGYGVTSITRPAVTAQYLGRIGFGKISGAIAVPFIAAFAMGPTIGSWIWGHQGYDALLIFTAASAALGAMSLVLAMRAATAART